MPTTIEPHSEFRALMESEIYEALADTKQDNPIAIEVARLISGYVANFAELAEQRGGIPADIMRLSPRWPIEAVAMRLTTQAISESLNATLP